MLGSWNSFGFIFEALLHLFINLFKTFQSHLISWTQGGINLIMMGEIIFLTVVMCDTESFQLTLKLSFVLEGS